MGHAQRRKGNTAKHKQIGKSIKTKRYQRDIDQIVNDLQPQNLIKFNNLEIDEDLPGLGQFYCVFCSKYFINKNVLENHYKTKEHKKRVKRTKEEPYTNEKSKKFAGKTAE